MNCVGTMRLSPLRARQVLGTYATRVMIMMSSAGRHLPDSQPSKKCPWPMVRVLIES